MFDFPFHSSDWQHLSEKAFCCGHYSEAYEYAERASQARIEEARESRELLSWLADKTYDD